MTLNQDAVRTYRIVYTSGASPKVHEYSSRHLLEAQARAEFLNSQTAKEVLGIKILFSGFDNKLTHA